MPTESHSAVNSNHATLSRQDKFQHCMCLTVNLLTLAFVCSAVQPWRMLPACWACGHQPARTAAGDTTCSAHGVGSKSVQSLHCTPARTAAGKTGNPTIQRQLSGRCIRATSANREPSMPPHSNSSYNSTNLPRTCSSHSAEIDTSQGCPVHGI